jgi:competence protein ComEA
MKTLLSCLLMILCLAAAPVAVSNVAAETAQAATVTTAKVAINTASADQLQALPGIGPSIAQRIVDYRSANGPFAVKEDLLKVKGIGSATLAKIRDFVVLD